MKYVRAETVPPPDLLGQHCVGLIYVPADRESYERRRRQVVLLHAEGPSTTEIAKKAHLSQRRVQQILHEEQL